MYYIYIVFPIKDKVTKLLPHLSFCSKQSEQPSFCNLQKKKKTPLTLLIYLKLSYIFRLFRSPYLPAYIIFLVISSLFQFYSIVSIFEILHGFWSALRTYKK